MNNYTCNCYVGFTGPNCDVKITNCTEDACYPNVTCFQNSDTISCGPCPLGLGGDGKNCEGNDKFNIWPHINKSSPGKRGVHATLWYTENFVSN